MLPETCSEIDQLLREHGFKCQEQKTDDPHSRWRYYYLEVRQYDSNAMLRIELKFDLWIHDSPSGNYDDNHELRFEEGYLVLYDRQMTSEPGLFDNEVYYDEETESLRRIGKLPLNLRSIDGVVQLIRSLDSST